MMQMKNRGALKRIERQPLSAVVDLSGKSGTFLPGIGGPTPPSGPEVTEPRPRQGVAPHMRPAFQPALPSMLYSPGMQNAA